MVASCGHERREGVGYHWDGLKRGNNRFVLFQYTLSGRGWLRYEDRIFRPGPGEAMLLRMPHRHAYGFKPDATHWRFLWVCLSGREAYRLSGEILRAAGPVFALDRHGEAVGILETLLREAFAGRLRHEFAASDHAYRLLMALAGTLLPPKPTGPVDTRILAAREFAQARFRDKIGVAEMAAAAGLSRHHFSRRFQTETGRSPAAFLKSLRLAEAARLLQGPTPVLGIKEVAVAAGFGDINHFIKSFRHAFGVTPGHFKSSGLYASSPSHESPGTPD
jgi:AraC-like DNA-binding protein